jgi:hypothetical protein
MEHADACVGEIHGTVGWRGGSKTKPPPLDVAQEQDPTARIGERRCCEVEQQPDTSAQEAHFPVGREPPAEHILSNGQAVSGKRNATVVADHRAGAVQRPVDVGTREVDLAFGGEPAAAEQVLPDGQPRRPQGDPARVGQLGVLEVEATADMPGWNAYLALGGEPPAAEHGLLNAEPVGQQRIPVRVADQGGPLEAQQSADVGADNDPAVGRESVAEHVLGHRSPYRHQPHTPHRC